MPDNFTIRRSIPATVDEFDFYDELNFGIKTWQERLEDWKKWQKTEEGKRAIKEGNKLWLKTLQ